ncbi:MAG: DUF1345 domain-containing protein [Bacteroidota bacterium]|nr:DUF1345 domain-containing protein [Bacteroidota bacterium]
MVLTNQQSKKKFSLLRLKPLHRMLVSLFVAAITFIFIHKLASPLIEALSVWLVFELVYLIIGWIILFNRPVSEIRRYARMDDGSKLFVFIMVLLTSFASIITVLILMISKAGDNSEQGLFIGVSIAGIFMSWFMVHTLYTFHYAHMYYDDIPNDGEIKDAEGLDFPQKGELDYIDFAYFSFVIGCTFQVSDVQITSRRIRHVVLVHQLISFFMNTFVVALTINLIAGLIH